MEQRASRLSLDSSRGVFSMQFVRYSKPSSSARRMAARRLLTPSLL